MPAHKRRSERKTQPRKNRHGKKAFGVRFHGVALGDGDIDCFKVYKTIRELSPTDRITFEIEWDMGDDPLAVAREKEMDACIRSIRYARDVLRIGE